MADPFVAEIRMFPFNFAPKGWAFCDGQLMALSQNTALFALLGTTYGGNGKSNFALPNLQGRAPMHPGQGPGLSLHDLGETSGSETVTLIESEIPSHSHALRFSDAEAFTTTFPLNGFFGRSPQINASVYTASGPGIPAGITQVNGGDQPHNNMQPYLTVNFCIALQGVFPPRS